MRLYGCAVRRLGAGGGQLLGPVGAHRGDRIALARQAIGFGVPACRGSAVMTGIATPSCLAQPHRGAAEQHAEQQRENR